MEKDYPTSGASSAVNPGVTSLSESQQINKQTITSSTSPKRFP